MHGAGPHAMPVPAQRQPDDAVQGTLRPGIITHQARAVVGSERAHAPISTPTLWSAQSVGNQGDQLERQASAQDSGFSMGYQITLSTRQSSTAPVASPQMQNGSHGTMPWLPATRSTGPMITTADSCEIDQRGRQSGHPTPACSPAPIAQTAPQRRGTAAPSERRHPRICQAPQSA